jgi:hypothetical protein
MEQPQTTPSVQSPRIQFREPSFSYAGGPLGVGVDGRTLLPIIFYLKIPIANNTLSGRLSVSDATNEVFIDDDPTEDWTRTTSEKDSWAHRERRRSSMWHKIESYPSTKPTVAPSTSPRRSGERTRRGSILSLFKHGKDKDGRDVLHSGDADDWHNSSAAAAVATAVQDEPSSPKDMPRDRRGSILSMWTWGKDKDGRDVIHSGYDDDTD